MKGGPNRGQGRKPIPGGKRRNITMTDPEYKAVLNLLQEMRKPSK